METTNLDAEINVIAASLLSRDAYISVADWIDSSHFANRLHGEIWRTIARMTESGKPVDVISVANEMPEYSEDMGNGALLIEYASNCISVKNVAAHAEIVLEHAKQRSLIRIANDLQTRARGQEDASELAFSVSAELLKMTEQSRQSARGMKDIGLEWYGELKRRLDSPDRIQGLATPWGKLNTATNGFSAGQLIVVAGRPGMGKSAFAVNICTSVAMRGIRTLFFNLEMAGTDIFSRAVSSISEVPLDWIRRGGDKGDDSATAPMLSRISPVVGELARSPLLIDDTAGLTIEQICARARKEHLREPLGMIVVDHMHIIKKPGRNEVTELGDISIALKKLAKELKVPVICLAQLNRAVEGKADPRPKLADLRGSGSIEQDADLVLMLYRDGYYNNDQKGGHVECIIAKQREGESGKTIYLKDNLVHARLDEVDERFEPRKVVPLARGFAQ